MKARVFRCSTAVFGLWLITASFGYAVDIDVSKFDFDGNGQISEAEARVLFKHANEELLRKYDKDLDGFLNANELRAYHDDIELNAALNVEDYNARRGDRPGIPIAETQREFAPPEKKPTRLFGQLLVRRTFEESKLLESPADFKKATGALFSFSRDMHADNEIWTVRGAVLWPFLRGPTFKPYGLTDYALAVGLSLDRIDNKKKPDKDVDSLAFRFGSEFEYVPEHGFTQDPRDRSLFETFYGRINLAYGTDTDFASDILQAEFQLEPGQRWVLDTLGTLQPGEEKVLQRNGQPMALNNTGDTVELIDASATVVQTVTYTAVDEGEVVTPAP